MSLIRRACDRCHDQKLRCRRESGDDIRCIRCSNAGARCVFSAPLPAGRPTGRQLTSKRSSTNRRTTVASCLELDTPSPGVNLTPASHVERLPSVEASELSWPASAGFPEDPRQSDTGSATRSTTATTSPSWSDFLLLPNGDPFGPALTSNLPFPTLDGTAHAATPETQQMPLASSIAAPFSHSSLDRNPPSMLWADANDTTEVALRQLSDINVRLYAVVKLSSCFAAAQKARPGALLGSYVFDSVSSFLKGDTIPPIPGCHAVFELFQSSRKLLDVLDQIRHNHKGSERFAPEPRGGLGVAEPSQMQRLSRNQFFAAASQYTIPSAPAHSTTAIFRATTPPDTSPSSSPSRPDTTSGSPAPPSHTDSVLHHLLLACYIRLLQTYEAFIAALQNDATYIRTVEMDSPWSLSRLRLMILVQLVTRFLDSLRSGMTAYFCLAIDFSEDATNLGNAASGLQQAHARDFREITRLESAIRGDLYQIPVD